MAALGGGGRGLWGRLGETRLGRWVLSLCRDYSSSALEAWQGARRRPGRALGVLTLLGALGVCAGSVPDLQALEGGGGGRGCWGSPRCRSPRAERRVRRLLRLRERGGLGVLSLGVLSLAREEPPGAGPALYSARCPHLGPALPAPPLDVGFLGRWWGLSRALRDCDVNDGEFDGLPEPLRRLDPRALRSEDNERLFMERMRPVVLRDEDLEGEL
ncbi:LOW QUALITY PROTEIN: mitochondrial import inner membrane translocase subunit Tim29 [Myiozetetes cayanensis]|uniref:LOW QUALITY PROTEIN: mitochondrial import inner membrane translocase subunit Tim29 n=1 Tax=Myiozetetes cayanensis TaxID=478635 RepID=UPI00215F4CD4|nr:LOW QUALITY PROTEIN: mitochondrial import inner membrane translocase subunit Tim29 [Myiozetetes cayanensis]